MSSNSFGVSFSWRKWVPKQCWLIVLTNVKVPQINHIISKNENTLVWVGLLAPVCCGLIKVSQESSFVWAMKVWRRVNSHYPWSTVLIYSTCISYILFFIPMELLMSNTNSGICNQCSSVLASFFCVLWPLKKCWTPTVLLRCSSRKTTRRETCTTN